MSLRSGDLVDTVLRKVSVDEFTPKTGTPEEVAVVGFYVTENSVGQDLYRFINNGVVEFRDVEVSPNPDLDNYYMVFVEMDRNEQLVDNIGKLLTDVENVTEDMVWEVKSYLMDDYQPWCEVKCNPGYIPQLPAGPGRVCLPVLKSLFCLCLLGPRQTRCLCWDLPDAPAGRPD